jgi:hypothetical protein
MSTANHPQPGGGMSWPAAIVAIVFFVCVALVCSGALSKWANGQEPLPPPLSVKHAFAGSWVDTGLPTDGPMSAGVEELGNDKWRARFTGIWEGRKFDYVVDFTGTRDNLGGQAKVNAAKYVWKGKITDEGFNGGYSSNRGHFGTWKMKRVAAP